MVRLKLYLPTEAENYDTALEAIETEMCSEFGGYIMWDATGGWIDGDGNTVREPVKVIEAYAQDRGSAALADYAAVLAARVKELTGEDAVAYAVNHEMMFA